MGAEKKKVIIIGAGLAGMCAGNYLQINGYDTEIFELHTTAGGLCTGWKRKEFTFDGCVHWLAGSTPADPFYRLWGELIDIESIEFFDPDCQFRYVSKDGGELNLYTDPDKLEQELLRIGPEDKKLIRKFIKLIKKYMPFSLEVDVAPEVMNFWQKMKFIVKILPYMPSFMKYGKISVSDFGKQFKNKLIRETFTHNKMFSHFAVIGLVISMVWAMKKTAGYPIGGSLPFIKQFEDSYYKAGGKINFNSRVTKITVENNKATGIELENGDKHAADIIVSAGDGHSVLYEMLEGKYLDKKLDDRFQGRNKLVDPFPSLIYVSLGIGRTIEGVPHQAIYQLDETFQLDPKTERDTINTTVYNFDPTLAPEGKTCVNAMFESYAHDYWKDLKADDPEKYKIEKQRIADWVINALDEKLGNIKEHVEVIDVATPVTFSRYTNNWNGSYEGWLPKPGALMQSITKELPGLKDFYMCGQWVESTGGLPPAILSARNVTQIICKREKRKFTGSRKG